MKIRRLISDDDAVSPVIGVILMVAITVILAAIIGAFVLGIGPGGEPAPTAGFDSGEEIDSTNDDVTGLTFEHTGGDAVETERLTLVVVGETSTTVGDEGALRAGDTLTLEAGGGDGIDMSNADEEQEIRIRWEDNGDTSVLADHSLTLGWGDGAGGDDSDAGITVVN